MSLAFDTPFKCSSIILAFFLKRSAVICLLRGLHCATELLLNCSEYRKMPMNNVIGLSVLLFLKITKSGILDQNLAIFGSKILKYPKNVAQL